VRKDWDDSAKAARTFAKRNGLKRPDELDFVPFYTMDAKADYGEDDALIDSLFEQTDEEEEICSEYLYGEIA